MKLAKGFQTISSDNRRTGEPVSRLRIMLATSKVAVRLLFSLLVALMLTTAVCVGNTWAKAPSMVPLDDVNGNGSPDVAVLLQDTVKSKNYAFVMDGADGAKIRRLEFFKFFNPAGPLFQAVVPDMNGNGVDEIAVLGAGPDGYLKVVIKDADSRDKIGNAISFDANFPPVDMVVVPDIDGNGFPEIAVLGIRASDGEVKVSVKDANSGVLIRGILFGKSFLSPSAMAVVPDIDGNGFPEIAVLGIAGYGAIEVIIRDAYTGIRIRNVYLGTRYAYTSIAMAVVPDMNGSGADEIAHLKVRTSNDKARVVIKDAYTADWINTLYFDKNFPPIAMAVVPDIDGNGFPEIAVLGVGATNGYVKVIIKDASTGALINSFLFDKNYPPVGMTILSDIDGNGADEIAVLGENPTTGKLKVAIKDAYSAELINSFLLPSYQRYKWTSISPGAGGAASAIHADPDSSIVLAGSDIGGVRHSKNRGEKWSNASQGIVQETAYADSMNFQAVKIFTVQGRRIAVGTTTPGVIYWSYITEESTDTNWTVLFNSQEEAGWMTKLPFGAIAVSSDNSRVFIGVGNINKLAWNEDLPEIPAGKAGTVLIFDVTLQLGEVVFQQYAEIKAGCVDPACQVSDLDSPDFATRTPGIVDVLVATTEGIYELVDDGSGLFTIKPKTGNLPASARFLSIAGANSRDGSVVVLVDEDSSDSTVGGVYLTADFVSDAPVWESRNGDSAGTAYLPVGSGVGKLKRSRTNPSEIVVSADKVGGNKIKGVYMATDIDNPTPTWVTLMDANSAANFDGWTRFSSYNNGVSEIAIKDNVAGIDEIYIGGFSGLVFRGVRNGSTSFDFSQIYCTTKQIKIGDDWVTHYKSRGMIELSVPSAEVYINSDNADQIYALYWDNIFFVSPDRGTNYSRPVQNWSMGSGVVFDGSSTYLSYVEVVFVGGNWGDSFDSAATTGQGAGHILKSIDGGKSFTELTLNGLPTNPIISAFTKFDGYFVCAVWGAGVYKSDDATNWTSMGLAGKNVLKLLTAEVGGSDVLLASYDKSVRDGSSGPYYLFNYYDGGTDTWVNIPRGTIWSIKNFRYVNGYLVATEKDDAGVYAYYAQIPATLNDFSTLTWTDLTESSGMEFMDIAYYANAGEYYMATATDAIYKATDFTDVATWERLTDEGLGGTKKFKFISVAPTGQVYVGSNGAWGFFRLDLLE